MSAIGFVGIGIMGKGMLKNLITKLDANVIIWNRTVAVCEEIRNQFPTKVTIAATPAEVVQQCNVTYTMLSTLEASAAVFDEPTTGVIAGVSEGKLIVDCATLSPARMVDEAARIQARGGKFLEAPVSGSKAPAETGTLIFLCGGDSQVFESQAAALDVMGKAKFLLGPVGQGTKMKLVVNMVMGTMMGAFAEGLSLAEGTQLPVDTLLQVLDLGAMANPMFKGKGPAMVSNKFDPNFPLKHAQKDMRLALEMAAENSVTLPTTTAANAVYVAAMEKDSNIGDQDFCAVIQAYKK